MHRAAVKKTESSHSLAQAVLFCTSSNYYCEESAGKVTAVQQTRWQLLTAVWRTSQVPQETPDTDDYGMSHIATRTGCLRLSMPRLARPAPAMRPPDGCPHVCYTHKIAIIPFNWLPMYPDAATLIRCCQESSLRTLRMAASTRASDTRLLGCAAEHLGLHVHATHL